MKSYLFLWLGVLFYASQLSAGFARGGGGDSVFCEKHAENSLEGYYSLDFFLTNAVSEKPVSIMSWDQSSVRILNQLKRLSPFLANSFQDFINLQKNYENPSLARIWEKSEFGLEDLKDEKLPKKLPTNCYKSVEVEVEDPITKVKHLEKRVRVLQTIIRLERSEHVVYAYDPKILEILRKDRPLQLSFLMVHEWLWDHSADVEAIRRLNALLHSSYIESLDRDSFYETLDRLGFRNSTDFISYCARSSAVRSFLESTQKQSCETISAFEKLNGIESIQLSDVSTMRLKSFDFHGFFSSEELNLNMPNLVFLPEWIFIPTPKLRKISLRLPQIREFYERTLEFLSIDQFTLVSGFQIKLPPRLFSLAKRVKKVSFLGLASQSFSPRLFSAVHGLESVEFYDIQWNGFPSHMLQESEESVVFSFCTGDFSKAEQQKAFNRFPRRVNFNLKCRSTSHPEPIVNPNPNPNPNPSPNPVNKHIFCNAKCVNSETGKFVYSTSAGGRTKEEAFENMLDACDRLCGVNVCTATQIICK